MNGHRCPLCHDRGRFLANGRMVDCVRCKPAQQSADIAHARAPYAGAPRADVEQAVAEFSAFDSRGGVLDPDAQRDGLSAPVRGRQIPPLGRIGTQNVDRLIAAQETGQGADLRFTLVEPSADAQREVEALANDELPPSEVWERGAREPLPFTLTDDEPEYVIRRRHDDLDMLKVARWQGGALGWCIGVLMALAATAWHAHGTLLP